jgi:hypothetical protein
MFLYEIVDCKVRVIILTSCIDRIIEGEKLSANLFSRPQLIANPRNDDEYFFNYRLTNFAPATEPLINETFGNALTVEGTGFWEHTSYTSHAVEFTTNLPAISIIEYDETVACGHTITSGDHTFTPKQAYLQHHPHPRRHAGR